MRPPDREHALEGCRETEPEACLQLRRSEVGHGDRLDDVLDQSALAADPNPVLAQPRARAQLDVGVGELTDALVVLSAAEKHRQRLAVEAQAAAVQKAGVVEEDAVASVQIGVDVSVLGGEGEDRGGLGGEGVANV
ncbi:MAG: hypothetical protein M3072_12510 [Candidatus Dormibacteraeota bacterium]|nr:hypothetical protein [Candidatus Dormibacteraeota bacterium]